MKAIQSLKQLFPFHHAGKDVNPAEGVKTDSISNRIGEYALGVFCFLLFIALGPFAAIPAFFATFSIPKWIEEQRRAEEGLK